jgi:hypothetical protein
MNETLILVTSHGLQAQQTMQFWQSLANTGFTGTVGLLSNDLTVNPGIPYTVVQLPWRETEYFRSSSRLFLYKEVLENVLTDYFDTVIITGIRDVIFQKDPSQIEHQQLDIYCEDESSVIGPCPYNSRWIKYAYGEATLEELFHKNVLCAEIVVGSLAGMHTFLSHFTSHAEGHENKAELEDQAMLNYLWYKNQMPYATCRHNEVSDVYTVGRVNPIFVDKHVIYNRTGGVPTIVHQYDRHIQVL